MRPIDEVIIHCSATRPDWMAGEGYQDKRDEIKRWHLARGWRDIGYHYLIDRDGALISGRPVGQVGAHVKGHNAGTIGVCLLGGHGSSENDDFHDNFTVEQDDALRRFIKAKRMEFPGINKISGHNEYAAKACPGFRVKEWLKELPTVADAPIAPLATEVPARGFWASIIAAILSLFGGKK